MSLEFDFSPFDAEHVLRALNGVLRASRAISFAYAGDIQSLIERIGRAFLANRVLLFLDRCDADGMEHLDVFEYIESGFGDLQKVAPYFSSRRGQALGKALLESTEEILIINDAEQGADRLHLEPGSALREQFVEAWQKLSCGHSFVLPMATGFLLLCQRKADEMWNKEVLASFVSIATFLSKVSSLEVTEQRMLDAQTLDGRSGFTNAHGFRRILSQEISRAMHFNDELCLIVIEPDIANSEIEAAYATKYGEQFLFSLVEGIKDALGPMDIAARLSADRFAVILPRIKKENAMEKSQVLRKELNQIVSYISAVALSKGNLHFPRALRVGMSLMSDLKIDGKNTGNTNGDLVEEMLTSAQMAAV